MTLEAGVALALICFLIARKLLGDSAVAYFDSIAAQRAARAQEEARLVGDADYEHWHALFGDQDVATHGRFPPYEGTKHP